MSDSSEPMSSGGRSPTVGQIQVELQDWMGDDRAIAEAAWTSSMTLAGKEKKTHDQVRELVQRLARDGHGVPFESVVLRFWMRIPVFVDRQLMTHRMASMSGMSGRYRTMPDDCLYMPDGLRDITKNINALMKMEMEEIAEGDHAYYKWTLDTFKKARNEGKIDEQQYKRVREWARGILPQSSMTERTMIINLRSFANFLRLRLSPHAQPEIREVARQMYHLVDESYICPTALAALGEAGWQIDQANHEWKKYVE